MPKINKIPLILERCLPEIIQEIAKEYGVTPYAKNPYFLDSRLNKWHQFGLLTHTKKVRAAFLDEIPILLKAWNLNSLEDLYDKNLFEASIPLHDLGKIISYWDKSTIRGHELLSKNLIRENFLINKLKLLGLSKEQIGYISDCVETHYALGKEIRDVLNYNQKFTLEDLLGEEVNRLCKSLENKYPALKTEIGVFYLCDSLGKIDIRINAGNDDEIIQQESDIIKKLTQKNLPENLKYAVMQLPVNIKLAEVYLRKISFPHKGE